MIEPSTQLQESKSLGHSTTYATFGMPSLIPSYPSLNDLLTNICKVQVPERNSQDLLQLYHVFETNRTSLQTAIDMYSSQVDQENKQKHKKEQLQKAPETLEQAVNVGLSPKTHECVLQSYCFDDLRIIGEYYCLENTSAAVFGGVTDGDFRKSNFASSHEKSSEPDLTLRCKFSSDVPMKKYDNEKVNLEEYRLLPWFVISYIELKKWNENLDVHVHHTVYYCYQTLSCCPNRNYFITALYNFQSIIFCMAVCINGVIKVYTTDEKTGEIASRELANFLTFDPHLMGFVGEFPLTKCTPKKHLGRGSTSVCLEVKYENTNYVAKISRNRNALRVERKVLKYLKSKNYDLPVPTVVDETDNPGLYAAFTSSNLSTAATILTRSNDEIIAIESPSNQLPYVSFLTEVYHHRSHSQIAFKHFKQLWKILKEVHKHGICHRDIRFPNLGFQSCENKQYDTYLLDWSSCKPFIPIPELSEIDNNEYLQGCTSTASKKVLSQMKENKNNYLCYPSDEAISVIYLAYQLKTGNKKLEKPSKPEDAIEAWVAEKRKMPDQVLNAINELEQMDTVNAVPEHRAVNVYEGFGTNEFDTDTMETYLKIIEDHLMTALDVLFRSNNAQIESKTQENEG
jgi:serine/threonine protein kinase